jgi:hypothetical protein
MRSVLCPAGTSASNRCRFCLQEVTLSQHPATQPRPLTSFSTSTAVREVWCACAFVCLCALCSCAIVQAFFQLSARLCRGQLRAATLGWAWAWAVRCGERRGETCGTTLRADADGSLAACRQRSLNCGRCRTWAFVTEKSHRAEQPSCTLFSTLYSQAKTALNQQAPTYRRRVPDVAAGDRPRIAQPLKLAPLTAMRQCTRQTRAQARSGCVRPAARPASGLRHRRHAVGSEPGPRTGVTARSSAVAGGPGSNSGSGRRRGHRSVPLRAQGPLPSAPADAPLAASSNGNGDEQQPSKPTTSVSSFGILAPEEVGR